MPIKKRCGRCLRPVRPDGTCQNPKCVRYVPEPEKPPESNTNAGSQVSDIGEKTNTK